MNNEFDPDKSSYNIFKSMFPEIQAWREQGYSIPQITKQLNLAGFPVHPSSVRTYYNEFVTLEMRACEKRMDLQLQHLARLETLTSAPGGVTNISFFVETVVFDRLRAKASAQGTIYQTLIDEALRRAAQSASEPPIS